MEHTPDDGEVDMTLSSDAESVSCAAGGFSPGIPEVARDPARVETAVRLARAVAAT